MITKNQELEVEIVGYTSEGYGVARHEGFVIFVPFAIVSEIVKVHIIKTTKSYAVGKIIEITKPSEERRVPLCLVYGKCGGCALQHISYEGALKIKKTIVEDALRKIGGFNDIIIQDCVPSNKEYDYRNKAAFPLFVNEEGKLEICMFRNLSHNPVYINDCSISDNLIDKISKIFKDFANVNYELKDLKRMRYLVLRVIDNKVLMVIVSDKEVKNVTNLYLTIQEKANLEPGSLGIYYCKKSKDNNVILEGEIKHLLGIENIKTKINNIFVEISPLSFFQVNIDIMNKIYAKVIQNIDKNEVVIDAYSGAGLLSSLIAQKAKQVYGIEIVLDATKNANELKTMNKIANLININGDASVEVPKLINNIKENFTVVLDPPRKGADEKVLNSIILSKPSKIIYVSCNPASLARDLKILCDGGYELKEVCPFDMFPQTAHVETFVRLEKRR